MEGTEEIGGPGQAAVPVGDGRAWPGFKIDHSEPKARVWRSRGRAAAHGRTKQPGPNTQAAPGTPAVRVKGQKELVEG